MKEQESLTTNQTKVTQDGSEQSKSKISIIVFICSVVLVFSVLYHTFDGTNGEKFNSPQENLGQPIQKREMSYSFDENKNTETPLTKASRSTAEQTKIIPEFHSSNFGGLNNIMHPFGIKSLEGDGLNFNKIVIPPHGKIPSLSYRNVLNHWGHYVHDEYQSPFSSFLYNKTKEDLEQEQKDYLDKMEKIRKEWGAWDLYDTVPNRPKADFAKVEYRDMNVKDFPKGSWQADETFVKNFISEARKLVDRTKKAIYKEYGHVVNTETDDLFKVQLHTNEEWEHRNKLWLAKPNPNIDFHGVSWLTPRAMDGLSRKLLHAMMTNDHFFAVYGGHSAAAGHGNNFRQNQIMQFNHIMEPLMAKLGIKLVSKNLCMGGYGTIHYSMGQSTLYGEKDFLVWDSSMTEPEYGSKDFFVKQALIGGERVPVVMINAVGSKISNLETETNGTFWNGDIVGGTDIVPITENDKQVQSLPYAAQYLRCNSQNKGLCELKTNKYHESCWEPRTDYEPSTPQSEHAGGQAGWHPGDRTHQFTSRKMAMTILHALSKALDTWEEGMETNGFPLKESYWHVGEKYKEIQSNLMTYMNGEGLGKSDCESRFPEYPKVCRTLMSGISEFSPINNPDEFNIRSRIKAASNGWHPWMDTEDYKQVYDGMELVPYAQKIPAGEVDVHAVVLATTYPAPDLDQSWDERDRRSLMESLDAGITKINKQKTKSLKGESTHTRRSLRLTDSQATIQSNSNGISRSEEEAIVPGIGWGYVWAQSKGRDAYCDGSSNSRCGRGPTDKCLLYSTNDYHASISGDGLSGWLVIDMPKMKEGLILAKLEFWHPRSNNELTKGWTEVNNGEVRRSLGGHFSEWPDDFKVDIAVNGKIVKTWNFDDMKELRKEVQHNEAFYPMVDDKNLAGEEKDVELAIRLSSSIDPRLAGLSLTHLYYA